MTQSPPGSGASSGPENPSDAVPPVQDGSDPTPPPGHRPSPDSPRPSEPHASVPGSRRAAQAAKGGDSQATGSYGIPGAPFSRSPFLFGLLAGLGFMIAYTGYRAVLAVWSILVLILVAAFFAIALNPAVVRLQRLGLPRGVAVLAVIMTTLIVLCGGLFAVIPPLITEATQFAHDIPGYVERLQESRWVQDLNERFDLLEEVQSTITAGSAARALSNILSGISLVFGTLFNILTITILTIYFLVAFERVKEGFYRLIPASRRERARLLGDAILAQVGGFMVGSLTIATLAGLTSLAFMLIVDIPYAIALAVLVALFDLIPQIGATLSAVVVTLVALTVSVPVAIATAVFFILYQQVENWLIYPRVMRRAVQVSDLTAILSVLVGTALFGLIGVLISIPLTAAIQLIIREVVYPRQDTR